MDVLRSESSNAGAIAMRPTAPIEEELFLISMAAEVLGMHPQTLRKYERMGLVRPPRTVGSMRLYTRDELERLRQIKYLVDELGINLAGVQRLIEIGELVRRMKPLLDERTLATEGGRRRLLLEMRRLGDAVGM
jgi:MerR family transcriptional regulator, heat shock protein HspR